MSAEHAMFEDAIASFVLGASDAEEAEATRAHLESCESCRALARRLAGSVELLPLSVEMVAPPEGLRDRVLRAAGGGVAAAAPRAPAQPSPPAAPAARVAALRRWSLRWPRVTPQAVAIGALAAALLALTGWNVALYRELNQPPSQFQMTGSGQMASAAASVTSYSRDSVTLISFRGMPDLPAGKVYQLWLIDRDKRIASAGVFTPDAHGGAQAVVTQPLDNVAVIAVTVESGPDGAPQPTQTPQLGGSVSQ